MELSGSRGWKVRHRIMRRQHRNKRGLHHRRALRWLQPHSASQCRRKRLRKRPRSHPLSRCPTLVRCALRLRAQASHGSTRDHLAAVCAKGSFRGEHRAQDHPAVHPLHVTERQGRAGAAVMCGRSRRCSARSSATTVSDVKPNFRGAPEVIYPPLGRKGRRPREGEP